MSRAPGRDPVGEARRSAASCCPEATAEDASSHRIGSAGASPRRVLLRAAVAAAALAAGPSPARAQAWPSRPVRLVVPFPPGGNADLIGRWVGERLQAALGQTVVVENRAGAGGTIGATAVAQAPGDGYTLLLGATALVAITHHLRRIPYDPQADLVPVCSVSGAYSIVAARKDLPASDMTELVALARREPGKLSFGSAGPATSTHLSGEIVHANAGVRIVHVPYKGSAEALADLVGGRIDLIYDPVALPQIRAGNLKALAVTSESRHPELPAVRTLAEQGLPTPRGTWFGVFAPRGTPREVVERVAGALRQALAEPGARDALLRFSQFPEFRDPAAFARAVREDDAFYRELIARLGIRLE